jgi:hypothetical protein
MCNKKPHNLYSSPNVIRVIKSRRIRWAGNIACMEEIGNSYKVFDRNMKEGYHLEALDIGWRIILRWILRK